MTLKPDHRRIVLTGTLAATIAVTLVFGENNPPPGERVIVSALEPSRVNLPPAPKPVRIEMEKLARMPPTTGGSDPFAAKSWAPQRTAARVIPPPESVPAAPPLPFEYVGQMEGRDGLVAYLAREGEFLSAKAGDALGADYRLESVSPEALTIVYVPLNERQTLSAKVQ